MALTRSVTAGALTAIAECAQQFRYETWSCPEQAFYQNEAVVSAKKMTNNNNNNNNNLFNEDNGKKTFKQGRSLKFKALKKNGNRRRPKSNEELNNNNSNNNKNDNSNNQIRRRNARKRNGKNHEDGIVLGNSEENIIRRSSDMKTVIPRATTRETAFVHAITAAGIAHTLTKNCSGGDFPGCTCDNRLTRQQLGWEWGGCSDNYHFGSQVAKQFLDIVESGADSKSLANLHNNEAGRIAVRKTMRRLCKCHGLSGSCATQTCWRQISEFREVGNHLKEMYHSAMK